MRTTIALLVAASLTAGCGGGNSRVRLPSSPPLTAPAGSPSAPPSSPTSREAVVAAYTALFPAVSKALRGPSDQVRSTLQDYATSPYLDFEVQQIKSHQANKLQPWGATVVHITKVDVTGDSAKVRDCQDASNAGLADARTHRLIPKSRGTANRNLIADMTLGGDGRWRLADLRLYQTPCHVS